MADKLITGNSWSSGDQVTSALLNQAINSATFGTGAVDSSTTQISSGAIIVKDAGITPAKLSAGGPTWTTAGALTVSGDTVVGDNATIGYTATEGLVITGQGSTNDVTIKNDADATVISIPTGTTGVNFAGAIRGGSLAIGTDDTTAGTISAYGDGTGSSEGGQLNLYIAADHDSTYNRWQIDAYEDDLRIFTDVGEVIRVTPTGSVGIGITTPSTALQVVGGIRVGSDGNEDLILKRGTPAVTVGGSTAAGIITTTGTGAGSGHVGIEVPANDADDGFYIATDSDLDGTVDNLAVKIIANGNVGIGTASPTEQLDLSGDAIRIRTAQTPASATATGTAGTVCWDASYIYVCTATNTWKRVAIATW